MSKKLKIYLTVGLPGSGKSTQAREMVKEHPNQYVRINRDSLRLMFNEPYSKVAEKLAIRARDALIVMTLKNGLNPIVDDTNLNLNYQMAHIKSIIVDDKTQVNDVADIELIDLRSVPVETCIKRDRDRTSTDHVGESVIRKMYKEHLAPKVQKPVYDPTKIDCIICDIDGTLALIVDRSPYDKNRYHTDKLNEPIKEILDKYAGTTSILVVSGREDDRRNETEQWLQTNKVHYDVLMMRKAGDLRNDAIVKSEIYENEIAPYYNVKLVIDDRDRVVKQWREHGLICLQCAEGSF